MVHMVGAISSEGITGYVSYADRHGPELGRVFFSRSSADKAARRPLCSNLTGHIFRVKDSLPI